MKILTLSLNLLLILTFQSITFAQLKVSSTDNAKAQNVKATAIENIRFVTSGNLSQFVQELNDLSEKGFRVNKAFNYGGDAANSQGFAAVLELDEANTYEYDWLTSPNKDFLEERLNSRTREGFHPIQTFAITACGEKILDPAKDTTILNSPVLRLLKGDIFLLERINKSPKKLKDYKVYFAKIGIGKSPSKELQKLLEETPNEYVPFKVLFNRDGFIDFSVSVLLEDDLTIKSNKFTEYKFVKEVQGFEKEINTLAKQGYKFITGRRVGLIKYVVMKKTSETPTSYVFIDQEKYQKEFAKESNSIGNYQTLFNGDSDCDSMKTNGGKLIFEQRSNTDKSKAEHKFLKITTDQTGALTKETSSQIKDLLQDNFVIKDVFYSNGIVMILEKS